MTLSLRGEAANVLLMLLPTELSDYGQLVKRFEMRYGQGHVEPIFRIELKGGYQQRNETIQEFVADIARLVRLAYSSVQADFLERLAVVAFVDGLRDREIRLAPMLTQSDRLADAQNRALEIDVAKRNSRIQVQVENVEEDQSEEDSVEENPAYIAIC